MSPTDDAATEADAGAAPDLDDDRPSEGGRPMLGIVAAAVVGVVVVAAVLLVTLSAGKDDEAKDAVGDDGIIPTTVPIPEELKDPIILPAGDYEPMCTELMKLASGVSADFSVEEMQTFFEAVDFEALIATAPQGLVADLKVVQENREEVVQVLGQVDRIEDLAAADLPAGFLRSFGTLMTAATQKCVPPDPG